MKYFQFIFVPKWDTGHQIATWVKNHLKILIALFSFLGLSLLAAKLFVAGKEEQVLSHYPRALGKEQQEVICIRRICYFQALLC